MTEQKRNKAEGVFRPMRRSRQELSREECEAILKEGTSGVLALLGDGDYPYAVPLSYVYEDGKIYFHCAKTGHKLDAIRRQEKASFCVIGQDQILPEKFTTCFSSVIVFGKVRILEEEGEIRQRRREAGGEVFAAGERRSRTERNRKGISGAVHAGACDRAHERQAGDRTGAGKGENETEGGCLNGPARMAARERGV